MALTFPHTQVEESSFYIYARFDLLSCCNQQMFEVSGTCHVTTQRSQKGRQHDLVPHCSGQRGWGTKSAATMCQDMCTPQPTWPKSWTPQHFLSVQYWVLIHGKLLSRVSVSKWNPSARSYEVQLRVCPVQVPSKWMKYILAKGYVAVDGCSLTVRAHASWLIWVCVAESILVIEFGCHRIWSRARLLL